MIEIKKIFSFPLFILSIAVILLVTCSILPDLDDPPSVKSTLPQQQQEDVQLTLSATVAPPGEPITLTITNRTTSTIATFNQQSMCSIFTIQLQSGDTWENVLECDFDMPTVPIAIAPGESGSLTLNGSSSSLDPGILEPGVYRVEFRYKRVEKLDDIANVNIPWLTALSPRFTITSVTPQATPTH